MLPTMLVRLLTLTGTVPIRTGSSMPDSAKEVTVTVPDSGTRTKFIPIHTWVSL